MECVRGAYLEEDFLRVIEVASDMPLYELHLLIQGLIGFSDDQLEDCFMATRLRGKKVHLISTKKNHDINSHAEMNKTLAEIFPPGSRARIFYSFDFGDNWIFEIRKTAEAPQLAENTHYPRIVQEEGIQPL
jgi:hypothetical protein